MNAGTISKTVVFVFALNFEDIHISSNLPTVHASIYYESVTFSPLFFTPRPLRNNEL